MAAKPQARKQSAVKRAVVIEGLCPMPDIAQLIGGKWKLIILQILIFQGTRRFGELKKTIEGITQTMLTGQLRALEKDGLVKRRIYPEVPPKVEYSATQRARDLEEMFKAMHAWWMKTQDSGNDDLAS